MNVVVDPDAARTMSVAAADDAKAAGGLAAAASVAAVAMRAADVARLILWLDGDGH